MPYNTILEELNEVLDSCLVENATRGEQSIVRGCAARMWSEIFNDPLAFRPLLRAFDKLDWNSSLNSIREMFVCFDDILVEISNKVEFNLPINYLELRTRLHWATIFLGREVLDYVRAARIRLSATLGIAGQISLYSTLDFDKLAHLDKYDSERVTAYNLFCEFEQREIPMSDLEQALQVRTFEVKHINLHTIPNSILTS